MALTATLDRFVERSADRVAPPNRRLKSELPCRTFDPDLWFSDAPAELELAKSLCVDCPVRAECLAGALARNEPWGVWGAEIFEHGSIVARKRPRGRPRKDANARDALLRAEASNRAAAMVATGKAA